MGRKRNCSCWCKRCIPRPEAPHDCGFADCKGQVPIERAAKKAAAKEKRKNK